MSGATPAAGDRTIHTRLEEERKAAFPRADEVREFRKYARGMQRGTLTSGQQAILRGLLGNLFADNICRLVIQAPANRLQLAQFDVAANETVQASLTAFLAEVWTYNRLPLLAATTHLATLRDGNHALALKWLDGRVRLLRERWWDGQQGVFLAYDDDDRPAYAVREWKAGGVVRRTIWLPHEIQRYRQEGAGWRPHPLPEDKGQWPVRWVDRQGQPLGIPLVHFPNPLQPNDVTEEGTAADAASNYGLSELDGGVLGFQDEINDLHRDLTAAARFAGYPMLYGTGLRVRIDPETQEEIPLKVEPGAFLLDSNEGARFGVLQPGSLAELERTLAIKLRAVSRMTDVPLHLISGDWPSGVALLRAEMGLIEKVKKLAQALGPAWASAMHKATRLANAFGGLQLDEDAPLGTVFTPVESNDLLTMIEVGIGMRDIGFPFREIARKLGYMPDAIEALVREKDEERRAAAEQFGRAFDRGDVAG